MTLRHLTTYLPPELAHRALHVAVRLGMGSRDEPDDPPMWTSGFGRIFPNPIGLAAGWDKDAASVGGFFGLGFGFVEVGTVTPHPQGGNARPRLFRLPAHRALINRFGFPSAGALAVAANLERARRDLGDAPVIGASVGPNRDNPSLTAWLPVTLRRLSLYVNYFALNVSSPNTPHLRERFEDGLAIRQLVRVARDYTARALLVKLSPDLEPDLFDRLVDAAIEAGAAGLILTNTTTARFAILDRTARRPGGLSGAPLFPLSTALIAQTRRRVGPEPLLIGVGGVMTGDDALTKLEAGADLVQVGTALAYGGLGTVRRIKRELVAELRAKGYPTVATIIAARDR